MGASQHIVLVNLVSGLSVLIGPKVINNIRYATHLFTLGIAIFGPRNGSPVATKDVFVLALGVIVCDRLRLFHYQRVSIARYASAGIARAEMSVCPSHSGIVSKRRKLAS